MRCGSTTLKSAVEDGDDKLTPGVAAVAIQSINTDIRAVSAALKAREQVELEERLEELERVLQETLGHSGARCRTLRSGGTPLRTGDTMIFSHLGRPLGMP